MGRYYADKELANLEVRDVSRQGFSVNRKTIALTILPVRGNAMVIIRDIIHCFLFSIDRDCLWQQA